MEKAKGFNIHGMTYLRNDLHENRNYELEIGDYKRFKEFQPQIKFKGFDNTGNLSIRLIDDDAQFKPIRSDDKIRLENKTKIIEFFDLGQGRFEFGVIVNEKPSDNKIQFSLRAKNCTFHQQWTREEAIIETGDPDVYVPDYIERSIAVYHYDPLFKRYGTSNYGTGKLFDILRPWAQDDNHNRVWCDMDLDGDILTITLPIEFYNTAKYPVFIDPTFGYSTKGNSEISTLTKQHIANNVNHHYTASSDQEVNYFYIWLRRTTGTCSVDLGVYDMGVGNNDPASATLVGTAQTFNITNTDTQTLQSTEELGIALTNGNNYAISIGNVSNNAGQGKLLVDYFTGTTGMKISNNTGALESPFTVSSSSSYAVSMYIVTGNQPAAPVFSGTVPNYSDSRVTPFSIEFASYFSETGTFTGTNLPAGSSLSSTTGVLTWDSPVTGVYNTVSVTCTNGLGSDTTNTFSITITAQNPVFAGTISNQVGNVSSAFSLDTSTFFTYADSYSISAGTLPTGLSIGTSTGIISGTPTTIQTQTGITVRGTNPDGTDDSNAFQIDIQAALPIPSITSIDNFRRGETVTINGSNFEASQGAGFVTVNGTAVTETSWSDTAIQFTNLSDGVRIGDNATILVENNTGYNNTFAEPYLPETGYDYVVMSTNYLFLPHNSILNNVAQYGNVDTGDRFVFQTTASPEGVVTHDTEGVPTISSATTGGDYTYSHYLQDITDNLISPNGSSTITISTEPGGGDIYPPDWVSTPTLSNITTSGVDVTFTINELGTVYAVAVLDTGAAGPGSEQVRHGQANQVFNADEFVYTGLVTSATLTFSALQPATSYKIYVVAEDDESPPNLQGSPVVKSFTTLSIADTTKPTVTSGPTIANIQSDSFNLSATMSEAGSIYYVVVAQGFEYPSPYQVVDGTWVSVDDNPVDAVSTGSSSSGYSNYKISGLNSNTTYDLHVTAVDTAGNIADAVSTVQFTTLKSGKIRYATGRLVSAYTGKPLKNTTFNYQIQTDWAGEISDSGTFTTDNNGVFYVGNLSSTLGLCRIFIYKDSSAKSANFRSVVREV